jgi:hypothetical protein
MNPMTETYLLASKVRAKLTKEASRPDHDLRILVSHANLLDNLMDKIHEHRTAILNGDYTAKKIEFQLPTITHVSYIAEEDEDDTDSDSDSEDDQHLEIHYKTSEILYDSDEDEYESDDDISDDEYIYSVDDYSYVPVTTNKFRSMPTIDLSEDELEDLDSASDEEEIDITDLRKTPSLTYADTTDESDSEEEHDVSGPTHKKLAYNESKLSNGNLMMESLTKHENFTSTEIGTC